MQEDLVGLPLFLPGVVVFAIAGAVGARRLARALGTRPSVAWMLVMSLGIILSATLTPQVEAFAFGATGSSSCDLTRPWIAGLAEYLMPREPAGNVLMFILLGLLVGLLPGSYGKSALLVGAIALPFAIEGTQLLLPVLDRACESADVVDNLLGLAIGLALAVAVGLIARLRQRDPR